MKKLTKALIIAGCSIAVLGGAVTAVLLAAPEGTLQAADDYITYHAAKATASVCERFDRQCPDGVIARLAEAEGQFGWLTENINSYCGGVVSSCNAVLSDSYLNDMLFDARTVTAEAAAPTYALPDADSSPAEQLRLGTTYDKLDTRVLTGKDGTGEEWYKVRVNGKEAWVSRQSLLIDPSCPRHIFRKATVTTDNAKVMSKDSPGALLTFVKKDEVYASCESMDINGITNLLIYVNGEPGWISRKDITIENTQTPILKMDFSERKPIIYLSPSKQLENAYATGDTNEKREMEAVAVIIKQILDSEYDCLTYIANPTKSLADRATEAKSLNADVYLAIHSNAAATSGTICHGASTYCFSSCSQGVELSRNIVEELDKVAPRLKKIDPRVYDGMAYFGNIGYAEVREPTNCGMVAVLSETEFHDNTVGSNWIIDHHEDIARAYVDALVRTFDIKKL